MINELYQLSVTLSGMDIVGDKWHREYKSIPNIKANAPCVRIVFLGDKVARLDSVNAALGQKLRKYGNNQGTFPAMNLAPLYRITDAERAQTIVFSVHPCNSSDPCLNCYTASSKAGRCHEQCIDIAPIAACHS